MPDEPSVHRLRLSWATCLLAVFALGCQQESLDIGPTVIKPAPLPERTLVSAGDVYDGERLVGHVRTYSVGGENGTRVTRVFNLRNDSLGYVTDDGRAFRRRAHGGADLVANSPDLGLNVAAVMDLPLRKLEIRVARQDQ